MSNLASKTGRNPPFAKALLSAAVSLGVLAVSMNAHAMEKDSAQMALKRPINTHVQKPLDLSTQLKSSGFAFLGKVVDVQYRNSRRGIPHTFVTYSVEKPLRGKYYNQVVTLRFIGGVKKVDKNRYEMLEVSHVPTFEKGNVDFVFARNNGTSMCPLVGCNNGRFKTTSQGLVAANNGRPLGITDKEDLVFMPGQAAQHSMTHDLSVNKRALSIRKHDDGEEVLSVDNDKHNAIPLSTERLIHRIETIASRLPDSAETFTSVDINKPFSIPLFKPGKPASVGTNQFAPVLEIQKTDHDRSEEALLKDNRNNPVIK